MSITYMNISKFTYLFIFFLCIEVYITLEYVLHMHAHMHTSTHIFSP